MRLFVFLLTSLTLAAAAAGQGRTLHVPCQYTKIQTAIDAAAPNDTVLVAPGTYVENIRFKGKAITVRSSHGPAVTTIDGNRKGSVVTFDSGEKRSSVIEGFTITNGTGTPSGLGISGGGIYCHASSPTIRNNVITGNSAAGTGVNGGGGIACRASSSPYIAGNTVSHNSVASSGGSGGGGIVCMSDSSATIVDNTIFANSCTSSQLAGAGGVGLYQRSNAMVARNLIFRNTTKFGGGMQVSQDSAPTLVSNVIFENTATENGGGIQFWYADLPVVFENNTVYGNTTPGYGGGILANTSSVVTVRNAIVWNNKAKDGSQISVNSTASLTISYSDVQGGKTAVWVDPTATLSWGTGMANQDPLFVAAGSGDLSLRAGSSCIDAGDPATRPWFATDLHGNPRLTDGRLGGNIRVDMGACEFTNVRLEVRGPARPGTALTIETHGKPGLLALLVLATAPGQACLPPFGGLLFDPQAPWVLLPWGTVPSRAQLTVPLGLKTPQPLVFQELALDTSLWGNVSNAVSVTIR